MNKQFGDEAISAYSFPLVFSVPSFHQSSLFVQPRNFPYRLFHLRWNSILAPARTEESFISRISLLLGSHFCWPASKFPIRFLGLLRNLIELFMNPNFIINIMRNVCNLKAFFHLLMFLDYAIFFSVNAFLWFRKQRKI